MEMPVPDTSSFPYNYHLPATEAMLTLFGGGLGNMPCKWLFEQEANIPAHIKKQRLFSNFSLLFRKDAANTL
jgi:hypothetical protein